MTIAYEKSVERAIDQNGALRPYAVLYEQLPTKALALHSYDVIALVNASVMPNYGDASITITATTLDFSGYGLDAAQDLVSQLRQQHPDFNPGMTMLCRGDQLREMYGEIWGKLLAETLLHPDDQPVLYEMLFGGEPGAFRIAQRHVVEHLYVARMKMRAADFTPVPESLTEWQIREQRSLTPGEAQYTYQSITGERLPSVVAVDIPLEHYRHVPL